MIRKFRKSDIDKVMEIWLSSNIEAHPFVFEKYWKSNFDMVKGQLLEAEVYVYEDMGDIKGFIGLQDFYIAGIFVKKLCRGSGIGKKLLDYVKEIHSELTLNVYKKNCDAIKFYEREGFLITSEQIDEDTGEIDASMSFKRG